MLESNSSDVFKKALEQEVEKLQAEGGVPLNAVPNYLRVFLHKLGVANTISRKQNAPPPHRTIPQHGDLPYSGRTKTTKKPSSP